MGILEEEINTFEQRKAELLSNEGKFVLIRKTEVKGFFDTYGHAVQAGYEHFGLEPFLVKQIEAVERVQFIWRWWRSKNASPQPAIHRRRTDRRLIHWGQRSEGGSNSKVRKNIAGPGPDQSTD